MGRDTDPDLCHLLGHVARLHNLQTPALLQCWGQQQGSASPWVASDAQSHFPLGGLEQRPGDVSLVFSFISSSFIYFFVCGFLFLFLFNLCKHDGDEECLVRLPQTRLWLWAVNVKHTLEQTTGDVFPIASPPTTVCGA